MMTPPFHSFVIHWFKKKKKLSKNYNMIYNLSLSINSLNYLIYRFTKLKFEFDKTWSLKFLWCTFSIRDISPLQVHNQYNTQYTHIVEFQHTGHVPIAGAKSLHDTKCHHGRKTSNAPILNKLCSVASPSTVWKTVVIGKIYWKTQVNVF